MEIGTFWMLVAVRVAVTMISSRPFSSSAAAVA